MATALELWREANPEPWQAALDAYWDRIRGLNKDRLEDLDRWVASRLAPRCATPAARRLQLPPHRCPWPARRWFQEDLPAALKERKAPLALTKDELVKVVSARGGATAGRSASAALGAARWVSLIPQPRPVASCVATSPCRWTGR